MVNSKPHDLSAVDARRLIGTGELTPTELLEACLDQIDRMNPTVNAIVTRADDRARAQAQAATEAVAKGDPLGPLHGLPVAIKDLQPTEGITTTFGSRDFASHVPTEDAGIVARIRAAGGIVIGKTNIPEFSIGANTVNALFGPTRNPFDLNLTCGGSSGGSGVAMATNMAPLATGSDHGGSLRIPAAYSGVVGHRATPGTVPHEARTTPQTFYSVQGPMARTVADVALLLSVISERSNPTGFIDPMAFPLDAGALAQLDEVDLDSIRVAVSPDLGGLLVSQTIRQTFADRVERIARLVGSCESSMVDMTQGPEVDWRLRSDVFMTQYGSDAAGWAEDFNPNIRRTFDSAMQTSSADIAAARRTQMDLIQHFQTVFQTADVLICPTVSIPPFPWSQLNPETIDGNPVENYMAWLGLTSSITVVGHPVTALPCGLDEQGTPFGIQVVGSLYQDRRVLSIAHALEQAFATDPVMARPIPSL